MQEVTGCEVCGGARLSSVLNLGKQPLCDDLVPIGDDRVCETYPVEILYCEACFTAHQRYQLPKESLFSQQYHYRPRVTGSVLSGMADVVESCESRYGNLSGKTVLDVGCNDGSLLDAFKAKGAKTIGVEPTGAAAESVHDTINAFFDEDVCRQILRKTPVLDFITFTNVFAHIENLPVLVKNLKSLLSPHTVVIIENHYLRAILDTGQFDTFYHEHPRTYSVRSFEFIAAGLGLKLTDYQLTTRYGGNIRVHLSNGAQVRTAPDERDLGAKFAKLAADMAEWCVSARRMIDTLVATYGPLRAKAFPGRAAILIKLLELDERHISALYEIKGSIKVGHYVPGTRIPILPEVELYKKPDQTKLIVNFAWHISTEVEANLRKNGYAGGIVNIKTLMR